MVLWREWLLKMGGKDGRGKEGGGEDENKWRAVIDGDNSLEESDGVSVSELSKLSSTCRKRSGENTEKVTGLQFDCFDQS